MAVQFQETQELVPRNAFMILVLTMAATDVFILVCSLLGILGGLWEFAVFTLVTVAMIAVFALVRIRIRVDDENISVRMVKTYTVPLADVIDVKKGDIDISRNYSGWGIKKVKFRNYTAHGIDGAVTVKLKGRTVLTMTCRDPDTLYDILYRYRRQD